MKKKVRNFLLPLAIVAAISISIPIHSKAEYLDEQQPLYDIAFTTMWGSARAQSFKVDHEYIYKIEFYFDPGDASILIACLDNDLNPSNGNLSEYYFDCSSWTKGWQTWDIRSLSGDVHVVPGNTYYLILTPVGFGNYPAWHGNTSDADPYPRGKAYRYDPDTETWEELTLSDYAFKIYTDVDPVAAFSYYTEDLTLYVDASDSYTPDGDPIVSYQWDWDGDGTWDDSGITASHTYSVVGIYTVKLKVTDEDGHTDIESKNIEVTAGSVGAPPIALFSFSTDNFTLYVNASASYDPDGNITQYMWDWDGDGYFDTIETDPTATHTYASEGTYNVTLRVVDNDNNYNETTKQVTITYSGDNDNDNGTGGDDEEENNGGGWLTWRLPFSWFAIFLMAFIAIVGFSLSAFFLKPESIKALGYAPAAGSILTTIFIIAAILLYHSDVAWYWVLICILGALAIIFLTVKIVLASPKRRKVARSLFKFKV